MNNHVSIFQPNKNFREPELVWRLTLAMRAFDSIRNLTLRGMVALLAATSCCHAANIFWTGPTNTFVHAAGGAADKLTTNHVGADSGNNVWLQRGSSQPLYNSAVESAWNGSSAVDGTASPVNTLWAVATGPLTSANTLTYGSFYNVVGHPGGHPGPGGSVGTTFFVKIVSDNIYFQLKLTQWGNNDGGSFTYQRTTPALAPPTITVNITNPVSNAVFVAPTNVSVGATATASSGTVTNVQFLTNGVALKSVTTSPFIYTATNLAVGAYTLTAVATGSGISATSSVVNITVLARPVVGITNPAPGMIFAAPANVNLGASASVTGGTVTNVQFFTNGVALKSVATAPFTFTASNLATGSYVLTAIATASGISATSSVVNITVLPLPIVSITNPVPGTVFAAPANVNLGATATVASGSVTNVQFFTNGIPLASLTTAPFTFTANNLAAGPYALTAVATASGISATSSVVNITVLSPPVISITNPVGGSVFAAPANINIGATATVASGTVTNVQFFTNGVSLASVTNAPFTFSANNLAAGPYALTAVATASGISATSSVVNLTVLPLPTVSITNPIPGTVFAAPANVSIGATATVASGTVTNVQFFTNGIPLAFLTASPFTLTANNLAAGAYAFTAVATASGISATSTVVNITVLLPPTVIITNPIDGSVFAAPANVAIGADAEMTSGTVTNVQFFTNGVSLASVTNTPFTLTASNLAAGTYMLAAVATAAGLSATSTVVNITVTTGSMPTVSLTNPPNGSVFAAPANLNLGANASPGGGPVTNVQFFANSTTLLGSVTVPPFTAIASNIAVGAYTLTAVATAAGISVTSGPVNVSVINPKPVNVSAATVSGGLFSFSFTSDSGLSYVVQSSSNLVDWLSLVTNTAAAGSMPFASPATNGALFYRIGLLPNP